MTDKSRVEQRQDVKEGQRAKLICVRSHQSAALPSRLIDYLSYEHKRKPDRGNPVDDLLV